MANERMRKAMRDAALSPEELAEKIGVGTKSVRNWLDGHQPSQKNAYKVASVLQVDVEDLFPALAGELDDATAEVMRAWGRRADSPTEHWRRLLDEAAEEVSILGYAILHLTEQHPDFTDALREKAENGCRVRIVVGNPNAPAVQARDDEEGLDGGLISRIKTSLRYLAPLRDSDVLVRLQQAPMYNSIFRFDDHMLVTPHLYGRPGKVAPMFELCRLGRNGPFKSFEDHFEALWDVSSPYRGW